MGNNLQTEQAIQCIDTAADISIYLTSESQAILMPFAKDVKKKYLVLVLFLNSAALNFETLSFICSKSIELLADGNVLIGLDGIEVMPCVTREGRTERVLRLSVLSHAIEQAKNLTSDQIRIANPLDGITSHIYMKSVRE